MAVITINGREFPAPDIGGNLVVATNVSDGKNANGEFVGQKGGPGSDISLTLCNGSFWTLLSVPLCCRSLTSLW